VPEAQALLRYCLPLQRRGKTRRFAHTRLSCAPWRVSWAPTERWPSGRRRSPAKGVGLKRLSWVRIPSSPPSSSTTAVSSPRGQRNRCANYARASTTLPSAQRHRTDAIFLRRWASSPQPPWPSDWSSPLRVRVRSSVVASRANFGIATGKTRLHMSVCSLSCPRQMRDCGAHRRAGVASRLCGTRSASLE
jgi:hypothetical protein